MLVVMTVVAVVPLGTEANQNRPVVFAIAVPLMPPTVTDVTTLVTFDGCARTNILRSLAAVPIALPANVHVVVRTPSCNSESVNWKLIVPVPTITSDAISGRSG